MPRESPELTTSRSKTSWDHQPHFVIYSLCLATGLEVIPEPREKRLPDTPENALSTSSSPHSACQGEQSQLIPGILGKAFQPELAWLPSHCRHRIIAAPALPRLHLELSTPRDQLRTCRSGKCSHTSLSHPNPSSGALVGLGCSLQHLR